MRWIKYNSLRTVQAAAYYLKLAGEPYDCDLLVKALYLADWECYRQSGQAMSGALFRPVIQDDIWREHIHLALSEKTTGCYVGKDPGDGELSLFHEEVLDTVYLSLAAIGKDPVSEHVYLVEHSDNGMAYCHCSRDGEVCTWKLCPQVRDNEPSVSGRSCPLPDLAEEG